MVFIPFKKMQERVDVDLAESDSALFWALMYYGEFVTKLTVAALVSAVTEERDRHRYRLTHRLVRADSIGDWNKALDDLLTGPASQYIDHLAREHKRQLTQRVVATGWQWPAPVFCTRGYESIGWVTGNGEVSIHIGHLGVNRCRSV